MTLAPDVTDLHRQPDAGAAPSLPHSTGPARPGFKPGSGPRGRSPLAHLERGPTSEPGVGPMLVVPGRVPGELAAHRVEPVRDENASRALGLHRADEALDHRDAAVLADRPVPWLDASPPAPGLEGPAEELLPLVADDVARGRAGALDRASQELADLHRRRALLEESETYEAARGVVHTDGRPPAEGPALDLREGCAAQQNSFRFELT